MLNRLGGMAIVRVRSRRKEHGRTDGSSVLAIHTSRYILCEVNPMLVRGDNACIGTGALLACG